MKKKIISAALLAFLFNHNSKAQDNSIPADTSAYKKQELKIEEINFITSFYTQDGNNSAVTGGVGTEKLNDYATTFDIKISKANEKGHKHTLDAGIGVDVYTSASSDKIDPSSVTSASYQDVRVYPSLNYNFQNDAKNFGLNFGVSGSAEFDYTSIGVNAGLTLNSKDKNREFSIKGMAFFDTWKVILPIELRFSPSDNEARHLDNKPRNSYNLGLVLSQVINQNFQLALLTDIGYQQGLLATKFNRVYFDDSYLPHVKSEKLPDTRTKLPFGLRANYFLGDNIVLRSYYRYYWDDWDITSHTFSLEPSYKINAFTTISVPYRYYNQTQAKYFKPFEKHNALEEFYTSDYDLSSFNSHMVGLSFKKVDSGNGILNLKLINSLEMRYGFYSRSNGLTSHILTLALKFK